MDIGAVVVAAGMSTRMGDFKPMMSMGTISIAQRVVATLRQAGAEKIVVVTGYNAELLERHLAGDDLIFLRNEQYKNTHMFDSAKIGLKYLRGKCEKVLFTPVDIPLFTAATVEALLNCGAECACPVCNGETGHPILLSGSVLDEILADRGEGGLAGAIRRCSKPQLLVEVDDPGILHDADTPEDYRALLRLHNSQMIRPVLRISLEKEKTFFDSRTANLLYLVEETRSVRLACQRMQLSYSSGWNTIKTAEAQLGFALIHRRQGGSGGSHSELTDEGRRLLERYELFAKELRKTAETLFHKHFKEIF